MNGRPAESAAATHGRPHVSVRASAAINLVAVGGSAAAGLLATATMARLMDPAAFGIVAIALVVANAASVLEGMRPVVVLEVSRNVLPWNDLFFATHTLARGLGSVATIAVLLAGFGIARLGLDPIQTCALAASLGCYFLSTTYWSLLDADGNTAVTGAARGGMWITVYGTFTTLAVLHAATSAYFLALLVANGGVLWFLRQRLRAYRSVPAVRLPSRAAARALYRAALNNISFNLAAVTLGSADRFAVAAMLGFAAAGRYSAMYDVATKPIALLRSLAHVLYPAAVQSKFGGGDFERQWRFATLGILLLAAIASVVAVLLREQLVGWVLGQRYVADADVFGIVASAFWTLAIGYCANIFLYATGDFTTPARIYAIASAIMVIALVPVITAFGTVGAASLFATTRLVDVATVMVVLRRLSLPWLSVPGVLIAATMAVAFTCAWQRLAIATCIALGMLVVISAARMITLRR